MLHLHCKLPIHVATRPPPHTGTPTTNMIDSVNCHLPTTTPTSTTARTTASSTLQSPGFYTYTHIVGQRRIAIQHGAYNRPTYPSSGKKVGTADEANFCEVTAPTPHYRSSSHHHIPPQSGLNTILAPSVDIGNARVSTSTPVKPSSHPYRQYPFHHRHISHFKRPRKMAPKPKQEDVASSKPFSEITAARTIFRRPRIARRSSSSTLWRMASTKTADPNSIKQDSSASITSSSRPYQASPSPHIIDKTMMALSHPPLPRKPTTPANHSQK
ncbi:hypothetical protein DFS34DRAFT_688562 [Phlyctochytrium arcticum]|nr:hypothetical protein DFS34DRAFT_688562 [Phlyctochytrium arcticum]